MLIRLNSNRWLTRDFFQPEHLKSSARDLLFQSQRAVQKTEIIGADNLSFFPRGNASLTLTFTVLQRHPAAADAAAFILGEINSYDNSGALELISGQPADGWAVYRSDSALIEALPAARLEDVTSSITYKIIASPPIFDSSLPPQDHR